MHSVASAARSLVSIWPRPSKSLLESSQRVSERSTGFRSITVASLQVLVHKGGEGFNIGKMEDTVRPPIPLDHTFPVLQEIVPALTANRHKGQAGKIGVIGGSKEYTRAPYYAAISALKMGVDIAQEFCSGEVGVVIKSYNPELIVHPVLRESHTTRVVIELLFLPIPLLDQDSSSPRCVINAHGDVKDREFRQPKITN